jgi:hypothetical protein
MVFGEKPLVFANFPALYASPRSSRCAIETSQSRKV